jgi:hypothetical protein
MTRVSHSTACAVRTPTTISDGGAQVCLGFARVGWANALLRPVHGGHRHAHAGSDRGRTRPDASALCRRQCDGVGIIVPTPTKWQPFHSSRTHLWGAASNDRAETERGDLDKSIVKLGRIVQKTRFPKLSGQTGRFRVMVYIDGKLAPVALGPSTSWALNLLGPQPLGHGAVPRSLGLALVGQPQAEQIAEVCDEPVMLGRRVGVCTVSTSTHRTPEVTQSRHGRLHSAPSS